jgi:hypothetical protein
MTIKGVTPLVTTYNDFFTSSVINLVKKSSHEVFHYNKGVGHQILKTNSYWPDNIKLPGVPIFIHDIKEGCNLYNLISSEVTKITGTLTSLGMMFYYWPKYSYIPWHKDTEARYNGSITVYLNEIWDRENGGYFMYEDNTDNTIRAVLPCCNKAIFQGANVEHCTSVNLSSEIRSTLQIFYK